MTFRKLPRGFTLVELMIVVVIVAILAAIGIPSYTEYVRRGKTQEATSALGNARVRYEQFFQDTRTYVGAGLRNCPASKSFVYVCNPANESANGYDIVANGVAAEGMAGYQYTITLNMLNNPALVMTSTIPNNGGALNCWTTKRGEPC